jgi:cytochrome c-type biogenesis protein CcmH/NrfF
MMARRRSLVWAWRFAAAACVSASVWAADVPPVAADPVLEARVATLAAELRCLVCQNQSLADSNAPLALDLKNQVREQLGSGRSERQVISYMTERYGDFVLYRPPVKATTLVLWGGPAAMFLAGLLLLVRRLRHQQREPERTALDSDAAARADALLAADPPPSPTTRG